jgi:Family of unknown function (DUF5763)
MARCQGTTKSGEPCRAPAGAGGLCFLHANPSQAREQGRAGGRKNRQHLPGPLQATTMTIAEVNEVLVEAVHRVRSNQLSARNAGALVQLCTALMRTLPAADLDARVTRLEEQAADQALGVAAELESDSGLVQGSAAQALKPNGNLGTTQQEQPAEQTTATSGVAPAANAQSQSAAQKQAENLDTEPE